MKIPTVSVGDKVTGTANSTVNLVYVLMEGNATFHLNVNENKQVILFLLQVYRPPLNSVQECLISWTFFSEQITLSLNTISSC